MLLLTGFFWQRTPVGMAVTMNVIDEDLIFVRSPWAFVEARFLAAWSSHHVLFEEKTEWCL